jgi:P4 family phage/plasmid primase-like protien
VSTSTIPAFEPLCEFDTLGYIRALFLPGDFIDIKFIHSTEKWTDDKGVKHASVHDHFTYLDDVNESTIEYIQKMQEGGWNAYLLMNSLNGERDTIDGKFHRRERDVKDCRTVWVEVDEDGPASIKKICPAIKAGVVPMPHFFIESSPNKYYAIWKAEGFSRPQQRALNKALQLMFGGDPQSVDAARVLRLPGTLNLKYPAKPMANIFSWDYEDASYGDSGNPRYQLADFKVEYVVPTYEAGTPINDTEMIQRVDYVKTNFDIADIDYQIDNLLDSHGYVLFHFDCPWKGEHTTPGDTVAIFLRPTGYGFRCFHQHCADRHWKPAVKDWFQQTARAKGHTFNLVWGDMPFDQTLEGKVLANQPAPQPAPTPNFAFNPLNINFLTVTEDDERGMDVTEVQNDIDNTEMGNAIRVLARDGKNIRYVKEEGEFIVFSLKDGVWAYDHDKQGVEKFTTSMVRQMKKEAQKAFKTADAAISEVRGRLTARLEPRENAVLTDEERALIAAFKQARALLNWAKECESRQKISASVGMLFNQSELDINVSVNDLDRDRMVLNVENGTLAFGWDGTITFRNHLRSDLCTQFAPVKLDPSAEFPHHLQFLNEMCLADQEMMNMLQEFFGLCLTGIVIRPFLILHGGGLDGKGTLTRIIARILGQDSSGYALMQGFKTFTQSKDEGHGGTARSDIKQMRGKRLVIASEARPNNTELNMQLLKQLTGKDDVNTRGNYDHDQTIFSPVSKIMLLVNHPPKIADDSKAARDRVKLVKCLMALSEDRVDHELEDRIVNEEASGVLNWMLAGLQRSLQRNSTNGPLLKLTGKVERDSLLFLDSQNPMKKFGDQNLVVEPASSVLPTELYARYQKFTAQNNLFTETMQGLVEYSKLKYDLVQSSTASDSPILGIRLAMAVSLD